MDTKNLSPEQRTSFRRFGVRLRQLLVEEFCPHTSLLIDVAASETNFPPELRRSLAEKFGCACRLVAEADSKPQGSNTTLRPKPEPHKPVASEQHRDQMFQASLQRAANAKR
jgi:hypothetical protein